MGLRVYVFEYFYKKFWFLSIYRGRGRVEVWGNMLVDLVCRRVGGAVGVSVCGLGRGMLS